MSKDQQIDLLLVNPGDRKIVYQELGERLSAIEPPVWAGLIATYVRNHGYNVSVLDAAAEGLGAVETAERIAEIPPALTAVVVYGQNPSASTMVMPSAAAICKEIKRIFQNKKSV